MTPRDETPSEFERIRFLLKRDGPAATQAWVKRTLAIYRTELADTGSFAADPTYRPRFETSVREFEQWLASQES